MTECRERPIDSYLADTAPRLIALKKNIRAALSGDFYSAMFNTALSWCFAGTMVFILALVADAIYFKGFSKTQAASVRLFKNRDINWRYLNFLPGPVKSFTIKEIKTFLRDQNQI